MDRRHFLMSSAAAAGSLRASANDTIRVASVGLRGRGNSHIQAFTGMPNVELAALCDVDESVLEKRAKEVEAKGQKRPALFTDLRKVLEGAHERLAIRIVGRILWEHDAPHDLTVQRGELSTTEFQLAGARDRERTRVAPSELASHDWTYARSTSLPELPPV